ncbi:DedA family protein [Candidatus Saccharibacteria bacterium]|nr:DedA family protein [Candidatus Saccharibacteria bacterium]
MNLTASLLEFALNLINSIGYFGVFVVLILDNSGIPIPSEATLALAGNLAKTGYFNLIVVIVVGVAAQTLGTYLAYLIGRYGGEPLVKRYGKYVLISAHDYDKANGWFKKRGAKAVFVSRLIPVIRTYAGFVAGTFRMPLKRFVWDSFWGSLIWTSVFVLLGYGLGDSWRRYYSYLRYVDYLIIIGIVAIVAYYIYRKLSARKASNAQHK